MDGLFVISRKLSIAQPHRLKQPDCLQQLRFQLGILCLETVPVVTGVLCLKESPSDKVFILKKLSCAVE